MSPPATRRPLRRAPAARAFAAIAAWALAASPGAAAQDLSAEERRIVAYVDAHAEQAIGLLERLVNVQSGTMSHAGVREVGRILRAEMDALGFATRWIEMPDSVRRAGHLFAARTGSRGRRMLLIGHLDTVFEEDSPFRGFVRQGRRGVGPGAADMKGGNVVIIAALRALHSVGALDGANVIVAFTGDEESLGRPISISRRDLIEAARRSDVALEFETGARDSTREYATVARRGSTNWRLDVTGRTGHSSGVFGAGLGSGAIFEAARILSAFHEELRSEPDLTFNPGVIAGGTDVGYDAGRATVSGKVNIVAQTAIIEGDLRALSPEQEERVRQRMREITSRHLPRTSATITFRDGYPPLPPTPGNLRLLGVLNAVNRDLRLPELAALEPGRRGASDASFAAPYADVLSGLGVQGSLAHAPGESADLESLGRQARRAALLIYRLTR